MEFLIALVIVFVGIGAWIHYYGDEVPSDEDYFSRSSRYSYEDDDSDDSDDDNDSDNDSTDDLGGDGD